jgi:NAD-dependent dihydropyrimidine dehydrogenase PreA subunit
VSRPHVGHALAADSLRIYANDAITLEIREDWCRGGGCAICVEVCAPESLAVDAREKAVVVNLDTCNECLRCEIMCPDFAITVR